MKHYLKNFLVFLIFVIFVIAIILIVTSNDDSTGSTTDLGANIVVVGYGTDSSIIHGKDGKTWQNATGDVSAEYNGIAYGTSSDGSCLWVAVGSGDHEILYRTDGIDWQPATGSSFGDSGFGITYGTSSDGSCLWVAVGGGTHDILYSENGIDWQAVTEGISKFDTGGGGGGSGVAYGTSSDGTDLWVAVGEGTHNILYSTDGTSWQLATGSDFGNYGWGIAYGTSSNGSCLWVAVGKGDHDILYSENGIDWQATATGVSKFGAGGNGVAYGKDSSGSCLWVAVGKGDYNILTSTDGIDWQNNATGTSKFGTCALTDGANGVAYGKTKGGSYLWVAVGNGDHQILYSTDGKDWQASTEPTGFEKGYGVAFDHLLYGMSQGNYQ